MALGLVCVLAGVVVGAASPESESPPAWSPDGRWLAYVLSVREPDSALPPGWLFEPAPRPSPGSSATRTYRLWATAPGEGESVLLFESARPIVSPSWNPDGTRILYGHQAPGEGPPRLEVVVQDAPDHREVLTTLPLELNEKSGPLEASEMAWSPDGRHIAIALPGPQRLLILRAENGNPLKTIADGIRPSWSPDGSRLAFYRGGSLAVLDAHLGELREILPLLETERLPAPIWSRDGQTMWVVLRGIGPIQVGHVQTRTERADLVRVDIETGRAVPLRPLLHEPVTGSERFLGASLSFDVDGNQLFYTTSVEGQRTQVTWAFPRDQAVRSRFNPVDEWTPLGTLRCSPSGARLALRAGGSGPDSPVLLMDPSGTAVTMLLPDARARAEWLALIVEAMRRTLAEYPQQDADGQELERPTLLPAPGELSGQSMLLPRVRHLARIGRQLVEPPGGSGTPAMEVDPEAQLAFAYLDQEPENPGVAYRASQAAIEAVEAAVTRPQYRQRLLVLRSQIALGLGDRDQAIATLKYLRATSPGPAQRVEETSRGVVLTRVPDAMGDWVGYLEERASASEEEGAVTLEPVDRSMGNINFDAPQPGLGLDPDVVPPAPPPDPRVDEMPVFRRVPRILVPAR